MKEERENQKKKVKKVKKVETEKEIEKEMEKEVEEVQQIEVEDKEEEIEVVDKEEEIEVVDKENRVEGRMEGREGEVIEGWRRKKGFRCIYVNNLLIFLIVKGVNKQKKWNKAEKG